MTAGAASLGMYDMPAIATANDALWRGVATRLRAAGIGGVPDALDRGRPLAAIWDDPRLILAQTCGHPFANRWRGRLRYVATPRYAVPGCEGAAHRSLFVARVGDPAAGLAAFAGRIAAVNEPGSNTGARLLRAAVGDGFFASTVETGSHHGSARAVAAGVADIAAIDVVTFAHLRRHACDVASRLRVVALSPLTPGLPLVTAIATPDAQIAALRRALAEAIADPALRWARELLLLDGIETIDERRYDALRDPAPETEAKALA